KVHVIIDSNEKTRIMRVEIDGEGGRLYCLGVMRQCRSDENAIRSARLVLQLYLRRQQSLSVMIRRRDGWTSPALLTRSPNMNQRNNLLPKDFFQEPSHFRNRQGHRSPRLRLNAVKLWKEPLPFFRRSDGIPCARMTVKKAWATMAKVMCRCHPVHERTS